MLSGSLILSMAGTKVSALSPSFRQQVYGYDPKTKGVGVIAEGFSHPNGIPFSPDEKTAYITDTGETNGDGSKDALAPATM